MKEDFVEEQNGISRNARQIGNEGKLMVNLDASLATFTEDDN